MLGTSLSAFDPDSDIRLIGFQSELAHDGCAILRKIAGRLGPTDYASIQNNSGQPQGLAGRPCGRLSVRQNARKRRLPVVATGGTRLEAARLPALRGT